MTKNITTNTREELYLDIYDLKSKLYTYDLTPNEHTQVDKSLRDVLTSLGHRVSQDARDEIKKYLMTP